ncbi:unnamed protein product [Pieris macdunnoughi]|uniref:Uncharacterized protein n=1 Tax=Pieris macdunnoughi TaxID=345717 RepID=A0A821XRL1_9NEOP|nr:unnamed protein product [Pieris macdunnoughi]
MVIEPIITYGASVWGHAATKKYNKKLLAKTQRGFALRATRAFKNVSTYAAVALAGFVPLDLKVLESREIEGARIKGLSKHIPDVQSYYVTRKNLRAKEGGIQVERIKKAKDGKVVVGCKTER